MQIIKEEFSRYASKQHRDSDLTRKRLVSMIHEFMRISMVEAEVIVSDLDGLRGSQQKYVPQHEESPAAPDADYERSFSSGHIPLSENKK